MIVPQYWAEARARHRDRRRQVTIRRFGWSDASVADAQTMADQRVAESLARVLAGERLPLREPKVPYNGAQGVPIREEIIERRGETVVTRNSYGARCLNTPNVLFADVDFRPHSPLRVALLVYAMGVASVTALWFSRLGQLDTTMAVMGYLFAAVLAVVAALVSPLFARDRLAVALGQVDKFLAQRSGWSLRLYRTPAGLRVLATHRPFDPSEPQVAECFAAMRVDPIYRAMCLRQHCFRARVSAKPWRIGIDEHLRPRPGVWPVAAERLPLRQTWVEHYEQVAAGYAACELLDTRGNGVVHHDVRPVLEWHDQLCRADRRLPLA